MRSEDQQRYYGLATFSILWLLAAVVLNGAAGRQGAGAVTLMWGYVAYLAFKGDMLKINGLAKIAILIQIGFGFIFWFIISQGNSGVLGQSQSPALFLVSVGIPTIAWIVLYFWSESKLALLKQDTSTIATKLNARPQNKPSSTKVAEDFENSTEKTRNFQKTEEFSKAPLNVKIKTNLNQVKAVVSTDSLDLDHEVEIDYVKQAEIIIEYNDAARSAYVALSMMPDEIQSMFLKKMVMDSSRNMHDLVFYA